MCNGASGTIVVVNHHDPRLAGNTALRGFPPRDTIPPAGCPLAAPRAACAQALAAARRVVRTCPRGSTGRSARAMWGAASHMDCAASRAPADPQPGGARCGARQSRGQVDTPEKKTPSHHLGNQDQNHTLRVHSGSSRHGCGVSHAAQGQTSAASLHEGRPARAEAMLRQPGGANAIADVDHVTLDHMHWADVWGS